MNNLPTIVQLYDENSLTEREKQNALNVLLNQPPKEEWVKQHPIFAKVKYLPIERVEYLLTRLFQRWYVEIKDCKLVANSVVVTVRLCYQEVVGGQFAYQDGIGAAPLQTDKGAGAADWNAIKSDAVMKAAPAAESYAVKDAAEKIGKIFGKDLNRAEQIMYDSMIKSFDAPDRENLEAMQKIIDGLARYQGKDKEAIRSECIKAQKEHTFTTEFAQKIAKRINVTL